MLVQHTSIQEYFDLLYVLWELNNKFPNRASYFSPYLFTNPDVTPTNLRVNYCIDLSLTAYKLQASSQKFNQTWITQDFFQEADMTKIGAQEMKAF